MALWDGACALVENLNQSPPATEIHPELVEQGPVGKVMLVGNCGWEGGGKRYINHSLLIISLLIIKLNGPAWDQPL